MIRRRCEGEFLLIPQHEHAQLAGRLARHFGNREFAGPAPAEATLAAVALHDCGWPAFDEAPSLGAGGLPPDVFATPLPISLAAWSASAQGAQERAGAYAGLLVSVHVLGLSSIAASHEHTRPEMFEINQFQHDQIERQDQLRRRLGMRTDVPLNLGLATRPGIEDEDQLAFNASLLAFADRISLAMCYGRGLFPEFDAVGKRPGARGERYSLRQMDERLLQLTPWPFSQRELFFDVPYRRVSDRPFASEAEFRRILSAAPVEQLRLSLRAG